MHVIALAAVAAAAAAASDTCVGPVMVPADTAKFARRAVAVLRAAGHDPEAYRLEIRREDPVTPYFPDPAARRVTSAMFLPKQVGSDYALRVNAVQPCVVSWVLEPSSLTPWQRRVLERAVEGARRSGIDWSDPGGIDISVLESRDELGIHVWRQGSSFELRLRKADLAQLDDVSPPDLR